MNLFEMIFDPNTYPFWILIIAIIAGAIAVISRPFSTYVKFVYPNAKFEAMGNPFITEKELSRVTDNKNLGDFKDALNASKDYNLEGENIYEIQYSLDDNFKKMISNLLNETYIIFSKGLPLLEKVQGRLKWELFFTMKGGIAILDKIKKNDYNVLVRRPTLRKFDWLKILLSLLFGGGTKIHEHR